MANVAYDPWKNPYFCRYFNEIREETEGAFEIDCWAPLPGDLEPNAPSGLIYFQIVKKDAVLTFDNKVAKGTNELIVMAEAFLMGLRIGKNFKGELDEL